MAKDALTSTNAKTPFADTMANALISPDHFRANAMTGFTLKMEFAQTLTSAFYTNMIYAATTASALTFWALLNASVTAAITWTKPSRPVSWWTSASSFPICVGMGNASVKCLVMNASAFKALNSLTEHAGTLMNANCQLHVGPRGSASTPRAVTDVSVQRDSVLSGEPVRISMNARPKIKEAAPIFASIWREDIDVSAQMNSSWNRTGALASLRRGMSRAFPARGQKMGKTF